MPKNRALLLCAGAVLLACTVGVSYLSQFFFYGTGHTQRPILLFLLLEMISFGAFFVAVEAVRRFDGNLRWILFVGLACRVALLPSQLIQESDPYRYIWDGQMLLAGENPYCLAPGHVGEAGKAHLLGQDSQAAAVFERINHPGVRTIYPPFAQGLFAMAQSLTPWSLAGWKAMIFLAEILNILLLTLILRHFGMRKDWVLLYAWCPLILKEFFNSLHVDVFAVLFLFAMIYFLAIRWTLAAYGSLACAVLVKWFPILLFPLLLTWTFRENKGKAAIGASVFAGLLALFHLPFCLPSWGPPAMVFDGLGKFLTVWKVNDGLFSVIQMVIGSALLSRGIAFGLILTIIAGACYALREKRDITSFYRACLLVVAAGFFLAPTGNPWYYTWVFPFLVFLPLRSLLLFSGLVFLYYLDFWFAYRGASSEFVWVRVAEYGCFYSYLGWEIWKRTLKSRSLCPLPMSGNLSPTR